MGRCPLRRLPRKPRRSPRGYPGGQSAVRQAHLDALKDWIDAGAKGTVVADASCSVAPMPAAEDSPAEASSGTARTVAAAPRRPRVSRGNVGRRNKVFSSVIEGSDVNVNSADDGEAADRLAVRFKSCFTSRHGCRLPHSCRLFRSFWRICGTAPITETMLNTSAREASEKVKHPTTTRCVAIQRSTSPPASRWTGRAKMLAVFHCSPHRQCRALEVSLPPVPGEERVTFHASGGSYRYQPASTTKKVLLNALD